MNFFDLLIVSAKALKRLVKGMCHDLGALVRLSYRQWYIVGAVMLVLVGLALGYSRPANRLYQVDGMLQINGPSLQLVKQVLKPVEQGSALPLVKQLRCYDVIDCLADSVADFVDYKARVGYTDTLNRHMEDHLAIRFLVHDTARLAAVESSLLQYLNEQPQLLSAYECYQTHLREQSLYCHHEMQRLDSLSNAFYFEQGLMPQLSTDYKSLLIGERRIHLLLKDVRAHIAYMHEVDRSLARATAPVVVEGGLAICPIAKNHPFRMVFYALLAGYLLGCLIAWTVESRKTISAWLKQ